LHCGKERSLLLEKVHGKLGVRHSGNDVDKLKFLGKNRTLFGKHFGESACQNQNNLALHVSFMNL
jgi:hypothetical protein